ncbi:MAG: ArgE/DapE family deacylase [Bacteroidota bacterium]
MQALCTDTYQTNELLSELISIASVNPNLSRNGTGEYKIASFLQSYLQQMGLEVHFQKISDQQANVVGVWKGTGGGKSLMLNGHLDTVGVEGMEISPFDPVLDKGKMFGRGAIDMKSGVCAQIMAVKLLMDTGISLAGDVIISCVADEEHMSKGTFKLLDSFTADAAIVTEPTDLGIVLAHKGFVWQKIRVIGRAAHGSKPDLGVDAIMKAGNILCAIHDFEEQELKKRVHPLLGRASVHASTIEGGTEMSIYPDKCVLELERRTLPGEYIEHVHAETENILNELRKRDPQLQVELSSYLERLPLEVDPEHPIVKSLSKSHKRKLGAAPFQGVTFWTDAALISQKGIPTVIFGPSGGGLHAAIEYVEMESVYQTAEILAHTLLDYCGTEEDI